VIPELGHVALAIALCLALAQSFFGLAGPIFNKPGWSAASQARLRRPFRVRVHRLRGD
jgi:cytochrome c-type biogenesis protein CcmF